MKVLLCSPYEPEIIENAGGIAVWTKNIMDYYREHTDDVEIKVLPYNRSIYVHDGLNKFVRLYKGVKDYLHLIQRTRQCIKTEQYDVLHLCSSALWSIVRDYIVMRMAHRNGLTGVIHFHCGRIPGLATSKSWRWKILKRVVKLAGATIVLDDASYEVLGREGVKSVYKIPNPLSLRMCDEIERLKCVVPRVKRRILFVGHVLPSKGVYELIKACTAIPNVELRLVGRIKPQVKNDLLDISSAKEGDWLHLLGEKKHAEVLAEMLACDLFVFPSYTEGFPNVIIEAMACGCPIIATTVGAIPEMLGEVDGQCAGILISPQDVAAVYDAVISLIDDDARKRQLSVTAVNRVRQQYAMPSVWKRLLQVWNSGK